MTSTPTIDRGIVTSIVESIASLQADVEPLVEACELSAIWSDPDLEVLPEDRVWKLFARSANSLDMPDVGLQAGKGFQVSDLGTFGKQLKSCLTTYACVCEYIKTVNRFSSHSEFWLEMHSDGAWFCRRGIDLISSGRSEVEQFTIQLMIRLAQLGCGSAWLPSRIRVQSSTDRLYRNHSDYDGLEISCRQSSTAILLSSTDLLQIIDREDDTIVKCVRDGVALGRDQAPPTVADAARQIGFSVRSLQRELTNHGYDWSRLLDQVRLEKAATLLVTEMPLGEIARELGYTDSANFGRAFRRWTGATPRRFRRLVNGNKE